MRLYFSYGKMYLIITKWKVSNSCRLVSVCETAWEVFHVATRQTLVSKDVDDQDKFEEALNRPVYTSKFWCNFCRDYGARSLCDFKSRV